MRIEVHLLTHDEEQMLEWSLRHYRTFADKIIVHDGGPRGFAPEIAGRTGGTSSDCFVGVAAWDTAGELNDALARDLKDSCWRGTDADWVIVADADELIWARDVRSLLAARLRAGAAVLRPRGFEMFSEEFPSPIEHPGRQITELFPDGSADDKWYAKPIVFSPRAVAESGFGVGAHESRPVLRDGRTFLCGSDWPFCDGLALLHYKSIFGGLDWIAARYDATRRRLSAGNVRHGWGNFKPGREHAEEKRALLLPGVRRVVA